MAKFNKDGSNNEKYFCAQVFNKTTDLFFPDMHKFYEILFFLSGNVTYVINDKICNINCGDVLIIDMNAVHYPKMKKDAKLNRIALNLDPEYVEQLSTEITDLSYCFKQNRMTIHRANCKPEEYKQLITLFENLLNIQTKNYFASDVLGDAFVIQLLVLINKMFYDLDGKNANTMPEQASIVNQIEYYISQRFNEDITLDIFEEQFYLSKFHICRKFKDAKGISIHAFLTEKRLDHAISLLNLGMPIHDIYSECGFNDYSNFYRAFTKKFGVGPKEYLRNKQMIK